MVTKTFQHPDGSTRTVNADDEKALKKAVEQVKNQKPAVYPNINVPVKKGHDLIENDEALNTNLVDGTGAHNSPRDAVNDDGKLEGDPRVASPGAGEAPMMESGTGNPVGEPTIAEPKE